MTKQEQMRAFSKYLIKLYLAYADEQVEDGMPKPTEGEFAWDKLRIPKENWSRWTNCVNPPDLENLLKLVRRTHDVTPVQIFDQMDALGDPRIIHVLAKWGGLSENIKQDFTVKLDEREKAVG
ncbi:hypothetical protein CCP3SC15_2440010 [Gammaproteobacteria bacterium]